MKTILVTVCVMAIFSIGLIACNKMGKRGNGKITTTNRKVSSFDKIKIEGIFPVIVTQDGGAEFVKVTTDENLQALVSVTNDGYVLVVKTKSESNITGASNIKVHINISRLTQLDFKSVGSLISSGILKLDSLELNSESVGKLDLQLNAKYLKANLKSVGSTKLTGEADEVRINNKSIGSLNAYELNAKVLMIHNTAVGTAEVFAEKEIYIRSSAIGTLFYKGKADVKELSVEGIGKVKHVED
jgi:hypothetical protein